MSRVRRFIEGHKVALIFNLIAVIVSYGHMVFEQNIGIDTEVVIYSPWDTVSWETIGRHGLLVSKLVLGNGHYNPYMSGVLFIALFSLLGSILAYMCWRASGENDKMPYGLFMVLFSVCPIWMTQFYFALQRPEIALGMILAAVSVGCLFLWLFTEPKWYHFVISYLLGIWSFCSYQAITSLYIAIAIALFMLLLWNEQIQKATSWLWVKVVQIVGMFALIYISNAIITKICFPNSGYVDDQVVWGTIPPQECIYRILWYVKTMLKIPRPFHSSVYPLAAVVSVVLFVAILISKRAIGQKILLLLCLIGLHACPFLLTIYAGTPTTARSQCTIEFVAAFLCMLFIGWCREQRQKVWKVASYATVAASFVLLWIFLGQILRWQYTDDVRYADDVRVANEIAAKIASYPESAGLPVVFVGRHHAQLNAACYEGDMFGISHFEASYNPDNPCWTTVRAVRFCRALGYDMKDGATGGYGEVATAASYDMDCYPYGDYVKVLDNCVVVRLSAD